VTAQGPSQYFRAFECKPCIFPLSPPSPAERLRSVGVRCQATSYRQGCMQRRRPVMICVAENPARPAGGAPRSRTRQPSRDTPPKAGAPQSRARPAASAHYGAGCAQAHRRSSVPSRGPRHLTRVGPAPPRNALRFLNTPLVIIVSQAISLAPQKFRQRPVCPVAVRLFYAFDPYSRMVATRVSAKAVLVAQHPLAAAPVWQ